MLRSTTRDYGVVVNHETAEGDAAVWLRPLPHCEDDYTADEIEALVFRAVILALKKEEKND